jgi:hypothetical protein
MFPDTGIDDVKKQRIAEYAKHINDPVLSSLKMEGIRLLFLLVHFSAPPDHRAITKNLVLTPLIKKKRSQFENFVAF